MALISRHPNESPRVPTSPWATQRAWANRVRRRSTHQPPLVIVIPALLMALLMVVPIVYLVIRASEAGDDIWPLIFRERTATIFLNTVKLSAGVAIADVIIAVPLAWLTTRTDLPMRRFWATVAGLPLVIPSYAGSLAIIGALGPRGLLQEWLEPLGVERLPSIYGYFGAWGTLTLFTYPYVYTATRAALLGVDPSLDEASRCLGHGPWRTFFASTLPQLRPAIGAGALLAALYAASDFGVVTLMRYDAFTRAIYTQYQAAFDRTLAAALGIMLVIFAITLLMAETKLRGRAAYHRLGSGAARLARPVPLGKWRIPAVIYCATVALLALGVPISTLTYWVITGSSAGEDIHALPGAMFNSVLLGALAAAAVTVAALPVALLAVRYPSRLSTFIERQTYLGHALPGIVIALAFVFLGARYLTPIYQTLLLLVIAMVVRFIPQAVGAVRSSLLQISPRLEEASRTLGRGSFMTTMRITLPLAWPGMSAGAALVFLTVMKELPITLLLSPTGFDTLATEVWASTGSGAYGRAAAPAMLLIVVSAIPTILLSVRQPRRVRR